MDGNIGEGVLPECPFLLALNDLSVVELPAVDVHGVAARGDVDAAVQVSGQVEWLLDGVEDCPSAGEHRAGLHHNAHHQQTFTLLALRLCFRAVVQAQLLVLVAHDARLPASK